LISAGFSPSPLNAVPVRLRAALVDGELDLEVVLGVAQIYQAEVVEVEAVGDLQPERPVVEVDRAPFVQHSHHHVNRLGHACLLSILSTAMQIRNVADTVETNHNAPRSKFASACRL
jgi:hypothetical protein